MVSRQEERMKALRWGCPWQGRGLLLGLLLWGLLPSPTASQDLATQLRTLKTVVPDGPGRIASSIRTAAADGEAERHGHGTCAARNG